MTTQFEFSELYSQLLQAHKKLTSGQLTSELFTNQFQEILKQMTSLDLSTNVSQQDCNLFINKSKNFLDSGDLENALYYIKLLDRHIADDGMAP